MASSFSELLKIAKAHSEDTKREALEAAKRREAALRQAREEQDRKERAEKELQKKLALKRAEEAKKEEERKKQREEEFAKRREELAKKKEEAKGESKSSRSGRSEAAAPKSKYINTSSTALTREEKRMAKDPLFKEELGKGKSKAAALLKLKNGRLPGGALPIVENDIAGPSSSKSASGSRPINARSRLSAMPGTLIKLNADKRDQRSIDEISRDLKRGKLDGPSTADQRSGAGSLHSGPSNKKDRASDYVNGSSAAKNPRAGPSQGPGASLNRPKQSNGNLVASSSRPGTSKKLPPAGPSGKNAATSNLKRSRSAEMDDSDSEDSDDRYYHEKRSKRPMTHRDDNDELKGDMRDLIWGLLGKNRQQYTSIDVESDDDMEVTGAELEREEMRSARLARQEDAEAEAEEKRRELEKKRKKMEKAKTN